MFDCAQDEYFGRRTALGIASRCGYKEIVEMLVPAGADIDYKESEVSMGVRRCEVLYYNSFCDRTRALEPYLTFPL